MARLFVSMEIFKLLVELYYVLTHSVRGNVVLCFYCKLLSFFIAAVPFFFFLHFSSYGVSPSTCLVMHESNMWKFGNASSLGFV